MMEILHENEYGHIAICDCCGDIQLCLGNVLMTLNQEEYQDFNRVFREISFYMDIRGSEIMDRTFVVNTKNKDVKISFTYEDLAHTVELLNCSNLMMSVNELTRVNEN